MVRKGLAGSVSRRQALVGATSWTAAWSIVPRGVLGGAGHVSPSERIHVGFVGCGTQGFRQMTDALPSEDLRIVAVCDPVERGDNYPDYGGDELNRRIRGFLNDPGWAKGARGALCGREPGREIVDRHYGQANGSTQGQDCRAYADVREMLQTERDLDAVYIMTPDHLHGTIAAQAMRLGKHVITHKPMSNVLAEARMMRDLARETGLATHLFCAADQTSSPRIKEWLETGIIGPVREVHNWSTRPFWPQGMTARPTEKPAVPEGFDWDLWVGPAAMRAYHPAYTHTVFRGWYDFGTGALGDMGHYSFHQIFEILDPGSPISVEASRSQVWKIEDYQWRRQDAQVAYPHASVIRWEFAERDGKPPLAIHWYDGGMRPPTIDELKAEGEEMPDEGMLFVGDDGKILANFFGDNPRLLPAGKMNGFVQPAERLERPIGELEQFVRACRGGQASDASFEAGYPFAETILLGTIAVRVPKTLRWDADEGRFTNSDEANALMRRENRAGWKV